MEKKEYITPNIEVTEFETDDVITTSWDELGMF